MPLPTPTKGQTEDQWIQACMGHPTLMTDFPDQAQRLAVCHDLWKRRSLADEALESRVVTHELRIDQSQGFHPVIRGYAIVFNSLSENLGGFRERIRPEAMDRTLREHVDLRALVDHDPAKVLGRLSAGTLRARPDATGLAVEIEPPDTTVGRDIVENIRRRDVTGMSFRFRTIDDQWDEQDGVVIRDVLDMRVVEVSVVTFPAYPDTDVSVAKRSLEAHLASRRPSVAALTASMQAKRASWGR